MGERVRPQLEMHQAWRRGSASRMVKKLVRTPPCAKYTLFRQIL